MEIKIPFPDTVWDGAGPCPKSGYVYIPTLIEVSKKIMVSGAKDLFFFGAAGAGFKKMPGLEKDPIFHFTNGRNIQFFNLAAFGLTPGTEPPAENQSWGDDGIYAPGVRGLKIKSCSFENFGDAAIRATGTNLVMAENIFIEENEFLNISQVTTTNNNGGGGAVNYHFRKNNVKGLKGSIKFASRQANTGPIWVQDNYIEGCPNIATSHGVELVSVSGITVSGNYFKNQGGAGITYYQNDRAEAFAFGTASFSGNTMADGNIGIKTLKSIPNVVVGSNNFINMKKNEVVA